MSVFEKYLEVSGGLGNKTRFRDDVGRGRVKCRRRVGYIIGTPISQRRALAAIGISV